MMAAHRHGGSALAARLAELGYDRGDLSAELLDALFALPSVRVQAFLEWFLAALGPRQSLALQLDAGDLQLYAALLDGGGSDALLRGEELEAQESALLADARAHESLDEMLAHNAALEREVAQLEAQLQRVGSKSDKIAKMVQRTTARADSSARRVQQHGDETEHFRELIAEIEARDPEVGSKTHRKRDGGRDLSAQIDGIVELLAVTSLQDDSADYAMRSSSALSTTSSQWREHLYQQSLAELQELEKRNLDELKAKVASVVLGAAIDSHGQRRGDLFALAADSSIQDGGHAVLVPLATSHDLHGQRQPPPSWLHDADPEALELHEQDALVYNKCSLELARLEKAFATGEQDALRARLQLAKYEALHVQLSESQHSLFQRYQLASVDALKAKRLQLLGSIESTKLELQQLVRTVLPKAFDEMAFLRSTTILLSSYEQKLWRQEHRFLKLRELLDAFDHQHGRLKLVHRFLDNEQRDLEVVNTTLSRVFEQLETGNAEIRARLKHSAHRAMTPRAGLTAGSSTFRADTAARSSISDADEIAHALFDYLLHRADGNQMHSTATPHEADCTAYPSSSLRMRTFDELVRLCERKRSDEASVTQNLEHVEQEWRALYVSQRSALLDLRSELFGDSTSTTPMLVPPSLSTLVQEAVASKDHAEQELHATLETLRTKKRALTMEPTMRQQQQEKFVRLQRELEERQRLGSKLEGS